MRTRNLIGVFAILLACLLAIQVAEAIPPLPHEFHGIVVIGRHYAPKGTVIDVLDTQGTVCGSFTLEDPGFYGYLSCRGDDPSTAVDEGASPGENITFAVDGELVNTTSMPWRSGTFTEVNLLLGPYEGIELISHPARLTLDVGKSLDQMLVSAAVLALITAMLMLLVRHHGGRRHVK